MATSSGGFWGSGLGRWLVSGKNIAGLVLAAAAVAAELVFGLGPLWPAIVAGSYAVGALVVPRSRVQLSLGVGEGASVDELQRQLKVLDRAQGNGRLDPDLRAELATVSQKLRDIVGRWRELDGAPDQQHTVQQMIGDYLPTSLQSYLDLPRSYATSSRAAGQRTAHDELLDQLQLLDRESGRIRDAVFARTVDALDDQGRFLREKFRRSSLDLGPSDGGAGPAAS
ncbi:MAG TPA: hypothetical protein VGC45_01590 [Gryllotalpicola sp.]